MKPFIAITPSLEKGVYRLNAKYTEAIVRNGGYPFLLSYEGLECIDNVLSKVDGVLLAGGGDLDPSYYGEAPHPQTEVTDKARDEFELLLCRRAIQMNIPLLAICRGLQALNVAFSGTLIQHVEGHSFPEERYSEKHYVEIERGTKLYNIYNVEKLNVNSIHHQAVGKVSRHLEVSARSPSGVVEAAEFKGAGFALGVQWHPEALSGPLHNSVFKAFIAACVR
jgi:putative glutamine amidotransferase